MSKRQTRKRINSIISVVLATVLLVSIIPSNLVLTPNNNYNNVSQADAASATDAASKDSEEKKSEAKDSEKKNSESKSVSLKKGVLENDDIIVEGMLPVNAVMETEEVDITIDGKEALIAYDINIYEDASAKKRGDKWQPEDDPLTVTFKAKSISADSVDVYHLEDEKSPAELVEENVSVDDNQVEFEADSFSIYAIVDHEGDEDIKTPRFTIHFLAPVTDTAAQESVESGEYFYTVDPYEFKNKSEDPDNNKQTTQIVQDGETLEMIANPPNLPGEYFFGWYVVNPAEKIENNEGEADDQYKFSWPESPKKMDFEIPITVTDNGDKTFTMTWTIEGKTYSETAEYDPEDYSAHIYVAPIYEDYCFVNFHELAYAVSSTSNLLTRKLVILGSDETEKVLISDVTAQATDTIRKIFRGWQYRTNNSWISVQTMNDNGNPITKYIDVTGDTDLYPYFQEGRWLYFNVGDSGNGAKYVPAQFTLAEFDSEGGSASIGGTVTTLPTTERQGYDFAGWRVITGTDPNTNEPVYELVTDEDGNFLNSVNLSVEEEYEDNDGNTQTGVAYTISGGKLTIKYPLSSLTFYAQWDEKPNTHYTVVIWKQKVTDDPDIADSQKSYDYYSLDTSGLNPIVNSASGRDLNAVMSDLTNYLSLTTNNNTKDSFTGFKLRDNNYVEMSTSAVRGDGSTIVNIYYDRITYELKFIFARRQLNNNNEVNNFFVPRLNGTYNPPATITWQAYCTGGSGMQWNDSGTNQLTSVCTSTTYDIRHETYNGYNYYYYVIKANYGQNIGQEWPDYAYFPNVNTGNNTRYLTSWWMMANAGLYGGAGSGDTVKGKIATMDKSILGFPNSPDGNFLIASYRNGQPNDWTYTIYLETLPDVDYSGYETVNRNGTTYYRADQFIAKSSNTNANQQNPPSYDGFDDPERVNPSNLRMDFYYNRQDFFLKFDYNYPVAAGMPATLKSPPDKVPYQTVLSSYDYKTNPSDTTNAIRPSTSEIPDHYEFGGWYEDIHCTMPANFNTTMPAADKIVYGKWTPVYYNICIDPNGGVIDHINYNETTDGGYPTFYVSGIASGTGAEWDAARAANGGDTSWASVLSTVGSGHNTSQSTYFSAMYGTAIGQYELERTYVEYNGTDDGTKYYYVNMQYNNNGEWGLHADMRNALYLTEAQLEAYYKYCRAAKAWHDVSRPGYYDGTLPDTFDAFKELYVKKNSQGNGYQLYEEVPSGSYAFVGWYTVDQNGNLSDAPYSFSNAVEESITLRAIWRRVGSYYIAYDPTYILTLSDNSTVLINGEITAWTDPANSSDGKYNDGATTTTLQQPTGITANGSPAEENYIFRGWEVVDYLGKDANNHPIYSPRYNNVYYAEPTTFIINSADADVNGCIHMRAVYQAVNESDRRPEIANLMLNANDGILVSGAGSSTAITSDIDITAVSGWKGAGIVVEDASENEIVFGNMQSNNAVHVYKYAVTPGTLDAPYDTSANYFKHNEGYLLIGFDEGSDYSLDRTSSSDDNLKTGEAFIPTYAADSVISVQRTDEVKLYAVWEPMVYVDFTNRTSQPVTFDLSGTGEAMSIVNERTGIFSREKFTETSVTLQPGETIKFVMPKGAGETFTISGTNTNTAQLLNVTSEFHDAISASATASFYRSSGADYTLSDVLRTDPDGVHVYFDGIDTIFFDVNGTTEKPANWTDTRTGSSYSEVTADPALVYVDEDGLPYEPVDLNNNTATATKPSDPTRTGYTFVGWTADPDVAACDPAGYTLPGADENAGINNMTIIKRDKLWDFDTEVSAGMTLYAVWGENVTVKFHLYNNNQHWNDTDTEYYGTGNNNTYTVTLAKGDTVRMPTAPTWNTTNQFYRWVTVTNHQNSTKAIGDIDNIFNFGLPVTNDTDLYTSWVVAEHIDVTISKTVVNGDNPDKEFTFTATIITKNYNGTIRRSSNGYNYTWTPNFSGQPASTINESQSFSLKNTESITIPLYFNRSELTINRNSTNNISGFFQSITIIEASDPNYEISVSVNGETPPIETDNATVNTLSTANPTLGYTGNNSTRTYYISGAAYGDGDSVPVDFTNTRTKTDVKLTKVVEPDDYTTPDESFDFSVSYKDSENHDVTVPAEYATVSLEDGDSVILRGVPIGGSITVTENAPEWTATSANTNTGANSEREFTGTDTITVGSIPSEGDEIVFTNKRNMNIIAIQNKVDPDEPEYRNTTKPFTYTAILKNTEGEQVAFPSASNEYNPIKTTQGVSYSFSNERKVLTFALKHDESLAIHNLPNGYYIEVTQTEDPDYSTRYETNGTIPPALRLLAQPRAAGDTKAVVNSILDDLLIIFINTLRTSEVTVTKHVQLPSGITLSAGENTFNFTAKLYMTNNSTDALPITTAIENANPGVSVDHDAKTISFTLTVDEDHPELAEITLTHLPVGLYLQVVENAPKFAAYVNGMRTDAVKVQIAREDNSSIDYINRLAGATIKIQKVDKKTDKKLKDAVFRLNKRVNANNEEMLYELTSDANGWLAYSETGEPVTEITLENGTYSLVEQTQPKGYKKLTDPITIVVDNTQDDPRDWITVNGHTISQSTAEDIAQIIDYSDDGVHTIKVKNEKQPIIVPTGVNVAFNVLSIAILLAFGVWLFLLHKLSVMRKRRELSDN